MPVLPYERLGYALVPRVVTAGACAELASHTAQLLGSGVGTRNLLSLPWCATLVRQLRANTKLAHLLPVGHVAVQCTYFTKSETTNWLVPVHQDTSIPVVRRVEHPDLRSWSVKEGVVYVQPPSHLLEQLTAVRLHIDPCGHSDGPLRVVPGSHVHGLVSPEVAAHARAAEVVCTAEPGDALAMRPLLLHSSSKSRGTGLRRVLHFLFAPPELPYGLAWRSVV